jgi:hypothetical protein
MKKQLLLFFLLVSAIGFSQVHAEIDTTNIRIGEQFEYKISVDEVENVIIPSFALKGLEIIDSLRIDTLKNRLIKRYILTGFDSGSFYIPQQQIFIKNQAFLTDSLLVNVATVAIDTTKIKKFPIKSIKAEPYVFDDYKNYLFWGLAILLAIGTILYFALRRKEDDEAITIEPALPPYQEALMKLNLLDKKLLWQSNKIKEYYSELTGIVRYYIERELKIPAMERTTDGLIDTLTDFKDSNVIITDKSTINQLKKLLQESDLVKFAKSKPLANEVENDRKIAESVINNLHPKVPEEEINIETIKPVTVVQKPAIKKPPLLGKILIIMGVLLIIVAIVFAISLAIKHLS